MHSSRCVPSAAVTMCISQHTLGGCCICIKGVIVVEDKIFPTAIKSNKPIISRRHFIKEPSCSIISRRHFIKEPSCSFEGDVTTDHWILIIRSHGSLLFRFHVQSLSVGKYYSGGVYPSMHWTEGCVSQHALGRRGICPGGVCLQGVCPRGCLPRGCLLGDVSALGCLPRGCVSQHALGQTPTPVNRMTEVDLSKTLEIDLRMSVVLVTGNVYR